MTSDTTVAMVSLVLLVLASAIVLSVLVAVYTRPPTRSSAALRRRLADIEEATEADHVQLKRLVKRYRALEGHVYGSMEYDDDEGVTTDPPPPVGIAPPAQPAPAAQIDFPEEEFRSLIATRTRNGGLSG